MDIRYQNEKINIHGRNLHKKCPGISSMTLEALTLQGHWPTTSCGLKLSLWFPIMPIKPTQSSESSPSHLDGCTTLQPKTNLTSPLSHKTWSQLRKSNCSAQERSHHVHQISNTKTSNPSSSVRFRAGSHSFLEKGNVVMLWLTTSLFSSSPAGGFCCRLYRVKSRERKEK